jgi:choline dehydrogenase-like flavoprotein
MGEPKRRMETEVVVVGTGPGGATMARELSRAGKRVVVCDAGGWNSRFGMTLYTTAMMDRKGFTFSKEGTWVVRPKTAGGASVVFCGTAFRPPVWLKEKYGIDLAEEVDALYREIPIQPLPENLIGAAARKIMGAARDLGLDWRALDKWIRAEKCKPECGGCFLGCREGARWTAREFIEEAREGGAQLLLRTKADKVLTQGGKAVGISARGPAGGLEVYAETVILSAGGQGTPPILQRSGIFDAGNGLFSDPLWLVVGPASVRGSKFDVPMTAGVHLEEDGIVLTDVLAPPLFYTGMFAFNGVRGWTSLPKAVAHYRRTLGIMVKVRDGLDGRVNLDESFFKPLDDETWYKLNKGAVLAEEILMKAGVRRDDLMRTTVIGAHPGGTVRIGELLDKNCQTEIRNCFCMDASIIPEPWGVPPTVTIVAMAKRLARYLTAEVRVEPSTMRKEAHGLLRAT